MDEIEKSYPGGLLSAKQAASYLSLSTATLAKLRCLGGSPVFLRLGSKIAYERKALDEWLAARRAHSTSDADQRLPRRLTDAMPPVA